MVTLFFYCFFVLSIECLASPLLRYTDTIQLHPQKNQLINSQNFYQFKNQIDASHNAVKSYLLALGKNNVTTIDVATRRFVEKSKQEQSSILAAAQKKLTVSDFTVLQTFVQKQQNFYDELLESWNSFSNFWQKNSLLSLQMQANTNNTYKNKQAVVQQGDMLTQEEKQFLKNRSVAIAAGLKKFFNDSSVTPFTLGYAAPGGGYRALILTSGYLAALEDLGLLDAMSYISAVSGSTWFLMPWIFFNGTVRDFQAMLLKKIQKNIFNPAQAILNATYYIDPNYLLSLFSAMWPKFLFNQQLSSVDVYGSLLSYALLPSDALYKHLPDQYESIKNGTKPFPIYNTVSIIANSVEKQRYYWNEFSPVEVRNNDFNLSFPAYAFGSIFDKGKSQFIAPLQALGYLMGTFGSAYLIDLLDVKKIANALKKAASNQSPDLATQYLIAATLINLINVIPISYSNYRALPSEVTNPFKNIPLSSVPTDIKNADTLLYLDGGLLSNIPGRSLMRKSRGMDVIFIGDTSGDNPELTETPFELKRFFGDAQKHYGYTYSLVGNATPTIRFYKDISHAQAPLVIYVNFVKDDALIKKAESDPELTKIIDRGNLKQFDFNCVSNLYGDYCSFLHFQYTTQEFNQLAAIAEFNIKANRDAIQKFLKKELLNK